VLLTIVKINSAVSAAARGVLAHPIPAFNNGCALEGVRLYPVSWWPASNSLCAIRLPIVPRPTKPIFAVATSCSPQMWPFTTPKWIRSQRWIPPLRSQMGAVGFENLACHDLAAPINNPILARKDIHRRNRRRIGAHFGLANQEALCENCRI
jgi:hypothetical protein